MLSRSIKSNLSFRRSGSGCIIAAAGNSNIYTHLQLSKPCHRLRSNNGRYTYIICLMTLHTILYRCVVNSPTINLTYTQSVL